MEAHQHPALLGHMAHRNTGAVTVTPGRTIDGPQHDLCLGLAQMPEIVFQHALLHGNLGRRLQMLHGAATARAEIVAARLDPQRGLTVQRGHLAGFPLRFLAIGLETDPLAGQRTFDEDDLALRAILVFEMTNAAPVHIERLDFNDDVLLHEGNHWVGPKSAAENKSGIVRDPGPGGKRVAHPDAAG